MNDEKKTKKQLIDELATLREIVFELEQGHRSFHQQAEDEKARTESIIAAIGDGISIQDTGFRVLYQNRIHQGFIGEHSGEFCYAAYEHKNAPCEGCPLVMSFRDGGIHTVIRTIQRDGRESFFEITSSPLRDAGGRIIAGIEVVRDISERMCIEKTADEARQRLQSLLEHIPGAVYRREAELPWKIMHISEEIYPITGYHAADFVDPRSRDFREIVFTEDREFFDRVLQEGFTAKGPYEIEYRIQRPDGVIRWVYEKGRVVFDKDGTPTFLDGVIIDITRRKNAEEELRKSEVKYREMADDLPETVYEADLSGNLVFVNRAAHEYFGYTREDFTNGLNALDMLVPQDRQRAADNMQRILKGEELNNNSFTARRKDGSTFPVIIISKPVIRQGNPVGLRGIIMDITERIRVEEEQTKFEKLESLGVLAGGIAHDFNNILTAILGNVTLASLEAAEGKEIVERLSDVEKAALRASDLTKQLLAFSKGGEPVKKMISLSRLLRESATFGLRGAKVKCEFVLPEDLWTLSADEGQISQVIQNLAINADQAMPEGGVIRIAAGNITLGEKTGLPLPPGAYVKISVQDHGTGIAPEHAKKIFDPYFTTKKKGSGLGLAVTYSIIRKHNGHISVESKVGTGTTFNIFLPARPLVKAAEKSVAGEPFRGAGKILIMDDEDLVRQVAGEILTYLGYAPAFAKDGQEALELYRKAAEDSAPFDAVILDLTVPGGMGGLETLKKLRELDSGVRAIVSSGYSNNPVMANYREHGFAAVISKPYKSVDFSKVLREVLKGLS